jgi:hypothetical protein
LLDVESVTARIGNGIQRWGERFQKTKLAESLDQVGKQTSELGEAFGELFGSIISGEKRATQAILAGIGRQISAIIQKGIANAVASSLSLPPPFGIIAAAAAGGAAAALFRSLLSKVGIPALAEGGIVSSPTLSLIGEAGPEAVIPLNQLDSIVGEKTIRIVGETRLDGRDIVIAYRESTDRWV